MASGSHSPHSSSGFGELRPSIYELPVFRVRFTDPEGAEHHASINTTWPSMAEVLADPESPLAIEMGQFIYSTWSDALALLGCECRGVDVVTNEFVSL